MYSFLWCIVSTEAIRQQQSIDTASGCDRCRGWLAPAAEQAILNSPALNAPHTTPTLGYFGQPITHNPTRSGQQQQQQQSRSQTVSLVDFWQALRGRSNPHSPQIVEHTEHNAETKSTADSSLQQSDKQQKEDV